jgi:hypothetical protein
LRDYVTRDRIDRIDDTLERMTLKTEFNILEGVVNNIPNVLEGYISKVEMQKHFDYFRNEV